MKQKIKSNEKITQLQILSHPASENQIEKQEIELERGNITIGEARMGENQLGRKTEPKEETEPASDAPHGGLGGREREARMGESLGRRGKEEDEGEMRERKNHISYIYIKAESLSEVS